MTQVLPDGKDVLWLSEADVAGSVSLSQAIEAVRLTYLRLAGGLVAPMPKTVVTWDGGTLHAIGAIAHDTGVAVAKAWAHTPGGATPMLLAWDAADGRLRAVIEAFALGQLRTSAVSGVATDAMAPARCDVVGVLGAGKQAEGQIAAVAAVRPVREIRIYSPTPERRGRLAARVSERSGLTASAVTTAAEAVRGASIVVTVTRAREPVLQMPMLAASAHINAVGTISPERAELDPAVVRAATCVVADDPAAARDMAPREFSRAIAPDVKSLGWLLRRGAGRPSGDGLSLFKAVGSGVSDLALAELTIGRATACGLGRSTPLPVPTTPRIWS
jgi:alanine dehydrogenase